MSLVSTVAKLVIASGVVAPSMLCRQSSGNNPDSPLPPYELVSMHDLIIASNDEGNSYSQNDRPFVVLGRVEDFTDATAHECMLRQSAMACCINIDVSMRIALPDNAAVRNDDWIAAFGRLSDDENAPDVARSLARFGLPTTHLVIDAELIVPAEEVVYQSNIIDLLDDASLSTFRQALETSGLADELRASGPITLFAPVNHAFTSMSEEDVATLMEPAHREALRTFVLAHIGHGRLERRDLLTRDVVRALTHEDISLATSNGRTTIAGARMLFSDLLGRNGVVHLIDSTLHDVPAERLPAKRVDAP